MAYVIEIKDTKFTFNSLDDFVVGDSSHVTDDFYYALLKLFRTDKINIHYLNQKRILEYISKWSRDASNEKSFNIKNIKHLQSYVDALNDVQGKEHILRIQIRNQIYFYKIKQK